MPPIPASIKKQQKQEKPKKQKLLSNAKIRVLHALAELDEWGSFSPNTLAEIIGCKSLKYITIAVGLVDPDKRAIYEQHKECGGSPGNPNPSLITLGYITSSELDIDGKMERSYAITPLGRQVAASIPKLAPISAEEKLDSGLEPTPVS